MGWRRKYYVDPEVQFPLIAGLLLWTTLQGLFLGWGFYRLLVIAKQWERPDQATDFFLTLLFVLVPLVLLNLIGGVYLSHKIAGPLHKMRLLMAEIARGNLEEELQVRRGDMLQNYAEDFNRMLHTLRRLLYRDYEHSRQTNDLVTDIQEWVEAKSDLPDAERKKLQKLLIACKSRLGIINTHFLKGRQVQP